MTLEDWNTLHEFLSKEKCCGIIGSKQNQYEPKSVIHGIDSYMRSINPAETMGSHIRSVLGPFQSLIDLHNIGKNVSPEILEILEPIYEEAMKSLVEFKEISGRDDIESIIFRPEEPR